MNKKINTKKIKKASKTKVKRGFEGEKPLSNNSRNFRLQSKCYFLTYKGISDSGQRLNKQKLAEHLLHNPNDRKLRPEKYLICQQMYDSGQPHFHAILIYPNRKEIINQNFYDYLGVHPNIQTMRNMKAALQYVYKEDPVPHTNMDIVQQRRIARAKDTGSLYDLLRQQLFKDPFNFDVIKYCLDHNIDRQVYKANYNKAVNLIKLVQPVLCNKLLFERPGFKYIDRALIEAKLSPSELKTYDSWPGYQTIVDFLNQIPTYRFRRPAKTLNLLITGPQSIGKSALVWQTYQNEQFNPLNKHCSVYPMGMKDWFPSYKSQVYDLIYWNEAKLTSYSYDTILQLLDGSPVMLPAKGGGHKKIDNPLVLMTSNLTLKEMIKVKFGYSKDMMRYAQANLAVRIVNVVVPRGHSLFLLQKLLVPNSL